MESIFWDRERSIEDLRAYKASKVLLYSDRCMQVRVTTSIGNIMVCLATSFSGHIKPKISLSIFFSQTQECKCPNHAVRLESLNHYDLYASRCQKQRQICPHKTPASSRCRSTEMWLHSKHLLEETNRTKCGVGEPRTV